MIIGEIAIAKSVEREYKLEEERERREGKRRE